MAIAGQSVSETARIPQWAVKTGTRLAQKADVHVAARKLQAARKLPSHLRLRAWQRTTLPLQGPRFSLYPFHDFRMGVQLCRFQVKQGDCLETNRTSASTSDYASYGTGVSHGFRGDVAKGGELARGYHGSSRHFDQRTGVMQKRIVRLHFCSVAFPRPVHQIA